MSEEMEALTFITIPPDNKNTSRKKYSTLASGLKAISFFSGSHEDAHAATLVGTIAQGFDYSQGGEAPLEAKRFTEIKKGLSKIKVEGISGRVAFEILMQSITIFQAYASVYEAIKDTPIKDYLPLNGLLFPIASLYLKQEAFLENVEAWQKARGTDKEQDAAIKVVGTFASCLLYGAQILVFLSTAKLAVSLQAALSTVIYASSFFELFKSEHDAEASQRERDHTPPQFILAP